MANKIKFGTFKFGNDTWPKWFTKAIKDGKIIVHSAQDIQDEKAFYCEIVTPEGEDNIRINMNDLVVYDNGKLSIDNNG